MDYCLVDSIDWYCHSLDWEDLLVGLLLLLPLTQLRNESVTTRSRPFANKFNYARDMCYGTSVHPASVKAVFEPGKSQKADGLTKVLSGALMKSFVSDLGLAPLIH